MGSLVTPPQYKARVGGSIVVENIVVNGVGQGKEIKGGTMMVLNPSFQQKPWLIPFSVSISPINQLVEMLNSVTMM